MRLSTKILFVVAMVAVFILWLVIVNVIYVGQLR